MPEEEHKINDDRTYIYIYIQGVPRNFSNCPQEGRWDRNKHKSLLPFSDIYNRDINV